MLGVRHSIPGLAVTFACVLSLFCVVPTAAEPLTSIRLTGDPSNRVDIVVVGDGYTASELGQYAADVDTFLDALFFQPPFDEYAPYFNVHRIDVVSNESGADHPDRTPAVFRDTALSATYNCGGIQRLICVDFSATNSVLVASSAPEMRDIVVVLVNDPEYGGSGGALAVASIHPSVIEIVLHEVGHSFGLLADEYGGPPPPVCNATFEPFEANATSVTNPALIKWNHWIDAGTPIPTFGPSAGMPGLYEGAKYCDAGLFRPTFNSKMRSLFVPFEQVNSEQLVKRVYNWTSPIDEVEPSEPSISLGRNGSQTFRVHQLRPATHSLEVAWSVDGVQTSSEDEFTLNASDLTPGSHTVSVDVRDTTPLVRSDPASLLAESSAWEVVIAEDEGGGEGALLGPDLVMAALGNPPNRRRLGRRFVVTDAVRNDGDASAASSTTAFYLSADIAPDSGDTQLRRDHVVPELAPGESLESETRLRVPATLAPGRYFLIACVDSPDVPVEQNYTNNCRVSETQIRIVP